MITIRGLSGIPGNAAGLPVSVIIPSVILGVLAVIIALRLNRDRNRTMREPVAGREIQVKNRKTAIRTDRRLFKIKTGRIYMGSIEMSSAERALLTIALLFVIIIAAKTTAYLVSIFLMAIVITMLATPDLLLAEEKRVLRFRGRPWYSRSPQVSISSWVLSS